MTQMVFGKGDLLALPRLGIIAPMLGVETFYTNPSYANCYSRHGFAVPLNSENVPFRAIMDGLLPSAAKYVKPSAQVFSYYLVDHAANCWNVTIGRVQDDPEDDALKLSSSFIESSGTMGWWVTAAFSIKEDTDKQVLLGFLTQNPEPNAIDAFCRKYKMADELEWVKISEIVAKLNKDYPKEEDKAPREAILREIRDLLKQDVTSG